MDNRGWITMIKFSLQSVFRKKTIAILSSLGVGFGLMLVFVVGAFTAGLNAQFEENLTRTLGIVNVVEQSKVGPESHLPRTFIDEVNDLEDVGNSILGYNVETQAPFYYGIKYKNKLANNGDQIVLTGINKSLDIQWEGFSTKIIEGRSFKEGKNETIIGKRLANSAEFPTSIGDEIEIYLDPVGSKKMNFTIVGIYQHIEDGTPGFVPKNYYIYTDIEVVWEALNQSNEISDKYSLVSFRFNVGSKAETDVFVDKINEYSEEGSFNPVYVSAFALSTFYEAVEENLAIIDTFTGVLGFITIIAGGMAIVISQVMSVNTRMKEFAIQKATGWKNYHIFLNITLESLILSSLGAMAGIGLGFLMIYFLSGDTSPFGAAPAVVTWREIVRVVGYAFGLGILGGTYPALKAARVRPVVVLKEE